MQTRTLPLFPLPLVLFPGTPQLLHIFEPRYRQMLADCQEGDRRFGLSYVPAVPEKDASPSPGDVGCVALVQAVRALPEGRSTVLAAGEERYVLRDFVESDRLYRVGVVETFEDEPWEAMSPELAESVRDAFVQFATAVGTLNDVPGQAPTLPDEPAALSFHVAAALNIEVEVKQELLGLRTAEARLERLHDILLRLNDEAGKRVAAHLHAKRNGKSQAERQAAG